MDKLTLLAMVQTLAASIPSHLDKPTLPPISWAQNGEIVSVVLADGRKVSASIQDINRLFFSQVKSPSEDLALSKATAAAQPSKRAATPRKKGVAK